jgi:beta-xylosidase
LWAPEIAFIRGTFWITYSLKGGSTGLLKSVSGTAAGPYIDMGRLTDRHIDSSLFADEDGEVYYVWQDGWIARMKPDMTGFAEHPRKLLTVDGTTVGYEGAFIVKYRGKYLLGAAEWNGDERVDGTYDMMVSVSDRLYGPYSPRQVAVPHGGHGTMFVNRDGELMATLFGNDRTAPFRTKLGIVRLECRFERGGAVIFPV